MQQMGVTRPPLRGGRGAVAEGDLLTVYRQLAALLDGGDRLVEALSTLAKDSPNHRLRVALNGVAAAVSDGARFSEALGQFPQVFRPEVVGVVAAAESSGAMVEALEGLAIRGDTFSSLARKASLPLVYPMLVCVLAVGLMTFLYSFILPKFIALFKEMGMSDDKFPLPTLMMIRVSQAFPGALGALFLVTMVLIAYYLLYRRTASGRLELDYWRFKIPLFGQLAFNAAAARMCATLGMLLDRGVPTPQALRLAGEASGNEVLAAAMRRAEAVVVHGGGVSEGLQDARVLPPAFLWRMSVADSSGTLPATCHKIAEFYLEATESVTRRTISVIEPVSVIVLGLTIGISVVSMFLPLISVISELSQ